jgi:tetratricopeptide (TPR) repeat protein
MLNYQREGKVKEAKEIGAGLAVLLKKITEVPKLSTSQLLFVGQLLTVVGEHDKAIETLKKVPPPEFAEWKTTPPDKIPPEIRGKVTNQIREYSVSQWNIAKALREAKRFSEAEKFLQEIIGTQDKQGWGWGRLYFRKELAAVYEDRGASAADVKAANPEWGKALQIWTTLWGIQKSRLSKIPPAEKMPDATAAEEVKQAWADKEKLRHEEERQAKNAFADAYFEMQRCLVKANQQLLKAQPPEKLQKTMDDVAKKCFDMETKVLPQPKDWDAEVQHRYVDLIKETPALLAAYKAAGGKFFLEKKATDE